MNWQGWRKRTSLIVGGVKPRRDQDGDDGSDSQGTLVVNSRDLFLSTIPSKQGDKRHGLSADISSRSYCPSTHVYP